MSQSDISLVANESIINNHHSVGTAGTTWAKLLPIKNLD